MAATASHRSLALAGAASLLAAGLLWRWRRRRCRRAPWDFEALPDRSSVHTVKHELPAALYGEAADGALNMWVADMELACCGRIQRAIEERARHGTFGYTLQPREAWEAAGRWLVEKQGWQVLSTPPLNVSMLTPTLALALTLALTLTRLRLTRRASSSLRASSRASSWCSRRSPRRATASSS